DPDCGDKRTPEASDQVSDKRRGDDHRTRADHADCNRNEELSLIKPVILLDEPLLEERHDAKAAAEGQRARLEKEQKKLGERRAGGTGRWWGKYGRCSDAL